MKFNEMFDLIFKAVALAMGVASIILSILDKSTDSIVLLLAIGLTCLAISLLDKEKGNKTM